MSQKELWNTVINSSRIWPPDHPLHHLDMVLIVVLAILIGLAIVLVHEWHLRRQARRSKTVYALWFDDWKKDSPKDAHHV